MMWLGVLVAGMILAILYGYYPRALEKAIAFEEMRGFRCLTNAGNNNDLMGSNVEGHQRLFHGLQNAKIAAPGTPFVFIV